MFNNKLKEEIALLKENNANLQKQYDLVYALVQERQNEVLTLRKQIAEHVPLPIDNTALINSLQAFKERVREEVNDLRSSFDEQFNDFICNIEPDDE